MADHTIAATDACARQRVKVLDSDLACDDTVRAAT